AGLKRDRQRVALRVRLRDDTGLGELMTTILGADHGEVHPNVSSRRHADGEVEVHVKGLPSRIAKELVARLSADVSVTEVELIQD
ncbi:MAG: hypothetical protein JWN99_3045, partial [Ilumatobacteraceae bacterium]|nr:hypothetical protein [Ilumatobacteraceae bacterium]